MSGGHRWNPVGKLNPAYRGGKITNKAFVERLYVYQKLSLRRVAEKCGCSLRTVVRWLKQHGIEARSSVVGKALLNWCGEKNPNWRGGERYKCPKCGGKKSYMSRGCIKCYDRRGAAGSNWKGCADVFVLVRQSCKAEWRPKIFKRDGYRCGICGDARGHNLQAHHLVPLHRILHQLILAWGIQVCRLSAAGRMRLAERLCKHPKVRSLKNGVTLCKDCHRKQHVGECAPPGCKWKGAYRGKKSGLQIQGQD